MVMNLLLEAAVANDSKWSIGSLLINATETLKTWGGAFIILLGVIMIVYSVYQIGTGLISHGKKQTNWFISLALLIVGGAVSAGGWAFVAGIAGGGQATITDLGTMIVPYFSLLI